MNKAKVYIQQIHRFCRGLAVDTIRLNQDGQYNDVLVVNETLIFRFAKAQPAVETLQREIAILQGIQTHVTLPIPNPLYCHVTTQCIGEVFVGYKMIPGQPLWQEEFAAITDEAVLKRMARQLATFLQELHRVPVAEAITTIIPVADTRDEWDDLYQRIQGKLFRYMRPDARRQVADHFEAFLADSAQDSFIPVLRHGDFGTGNILYEPSSRTVTGIIDFGMSCLGDPAIDFAALSTMGEAFYHRCSAFYPAMERALHRVHFYRGTFALQEALFGIEHNDVKAFRSGLKKYR